MSEIAYATMLIANSSGHTITMKNASSTFRKLTAFAHSGIEIQDDLTTINGHLSLNFPYGDLVLHAGVNLQATGNFFHLKQKTASFICELYKLNPKYR